MTDAEELLHDERLADETAEGQDEATETSEGAAEPEEAAEDESEQEEDAGDAKASEGLEEEPEDDDVEGDEDGDVDAAHVRLAEALLFASAEPLTERQLKNRLPEEANVKAVLKTLRGLYDGRGVELAKRGKSWAFRTAPDLANLLHKEVEVQRKLSRAAVETMAIVAYHQPVTRAEIEDIRGVSVSKGTMDLLLEHGWIKPGPRRETPGRPLTWRTTDVFLDHFGLESERELPGLKDLKAMGLLESGPALNVYRARGDMAGASAPGEELPDNRLTGEVEDDQGDEPLDPGDGDADSNED